jgi:hypothetical protein
MRKLNHRSNKPKVKKPVKERILGRWWGKKCQNWSSHLGNHCTDRILLRLQSGCNFQGKDYR